jgi:thiaminase
MMTTPLLHVIRERLASLNRQILNHPYLADAEQGILPQSKLQAFVINQHYIIRHDVRSLALMASRSTTTEEYMFFQSIQEVDAQALPLILKLGAAMGLPTTFVTTPPRAEAVTYAHYLATLAQYATPQEQVVALIVNLPVWSANCQRLAGALRKHYEIEDTAFLDLFSQPAAALETSAEAILTQHNTVMDALTRVAQMIQAYELMFWQGIYHTP